MYFIKKNRFSYFGLRSSRLPCSDSRMECLLSLHEFCPLFLEAAQFKVRVRVGKLQTWTEGHGLSAVMSALREPGCSPPASAVIRICVVWTEKTEER